MFKNGISLEKINELRNGTLLESLDIWITEIGDNYLIGTMPVDKRTFQPFKILHGGASVALAESIGSMASNLIVEENQMAVGLEINANHIRSAQKGLVTGKATAVHIGRKTHVWNIEIRDQEQKLVCICRLTMMIIEK